VTGACRCRPFGLDEAAGQRDRAALAEVFGADVGLDAEGGDVDKHRLVVFVVGREAQLAHVAVIVELVEDGVGGQVPDEGDLANVGC